MKVGDLVFFVDWGREYIKETHRLFIISEALDGYKCRVIDLKNGQETLSDFRDLAVFSKSS